LVPKNAPASFKPRWYTGNIYDLPRSLPQMVELPPSPSNNYEYDIIISGDYEVTTPCHPQHSAC